MDFRALCKPKRASFSSSAKGGWEGASKTFRVMKITAILLLIACLHVSARSLGQEVSLSLKDASLENVFKEIRKQTGYNFFYKDEWLLQTNRVTIDVRNAPITQVLDICFRNQPFTYAIVDNSIVIKPVGEFQSSNAPPAKVDVKGTVYNESGQPLAGANVIAKKTGKGTITNAKGEFVLSSVAENSLLIISFVGYASQEIKANGDKGIRIYLKVAVDELDKAIVQGYGATSLRLSTGNIGVVRAAEIEKQPVLNPLLALQGRIPGVDITQINGYASAPIKVEIRGRNSIDDSYPSDPLYIIDGVPLTVLELTGRSGYSQGSVGFLQNGLTGPAVGQSPLFSINPADIESIEVLKDADATSIYGSRAANGVIMITTKKGKPGKTQLNIHVDQGVNKVTRFWKMLNTPQYLAMRREAFKNDNIVPDQGNAFDLLTWDTTRYTDWQKALYGGSGKVTNAQVSLSGGDARTTFRMAATYNYSTAITTAHGADQRGSLAVSLSHRSLNQRFGVSFSSEYSFTKSDMISLPGTVTLAPNAPAIYDSAGNLNWKDWESSIGNPFSGLLQPYVAKTNFLNSNINFNYQPVRGLNLSTSFGYNNGQSSQTQLFPIASQDPNYQPAGSAQFGNNSNKNWIIEPQISYDLQVGPGKLSAMVGGSIQNTSTEGIYIYGSGYTNDALLRTISNAPQRDASDNYGEYRYAAIFGRLNYNISNKYIVNVNARRDGSSNFGPDNHFGNFASIGAAWIFTEETWIKNHLSFLSFGKIRGSYGTTGGEGGAPYAYLTRWSSNGLRVYNGVQPLAPTQHANPNYHWQLNKKLEGAIELAFFKSWVSVSVAYYRNRCDNQLLNYPTPEFSGFSSVVANLQALVQNAGWEFTIGGKGVHTKYFSWAPSFNFSINQNKLLSFPGLATSPFYKTRFLTGQPLNTIYLLHYTGVDPQTGRYTFEDKNHDGNISTSSGSTDDRYPHKISPTFATGFGFNFDYKGLNLSFFFTVKKQTGINAIAQGASPGIVNQNQPIEILNSYWQKPGDVANTGRFSIMGSADPNGYIGQSDAGYTDASYIRLQNISLSYSLPEMVMKKLGMARCVFFLHGENIFVITKYKGIDPETQNFGGLPPAKTFTGGISLDF